MSVMQHTSINNGIDDNTNTNCIQIVNKMGIPKTKTNTFGSVIVGWVSSTLMVMRKRGFLNYSIKVENNHYSG